MPDTLTALLSDITPSPFEGGLLVGVLTLVAAGVAAWFKWVLLPANEREQKRADAKVAAEIEDMKLRRDTDAQYQEDIKEISRDHQVQMIAAMKERNDLDHENQNTLKTLGTMFEASSKMTVEMHQAVMLLAKRFNGEDAKKP